MNSFLVQCSLAAPQAHKSVPASGTCSCATSAQERPPQASVPLSWGPFLALQNSSYFGRIHLGLPSFNFLGSDFFLFVRAALVIMKPNCSQNLAPKMGPPRSPIFGTYGGHFCGRSETKFNGIGGPKLGSPKTQIKTQNWCQFLSPSFGTICLPRDAISKDINQSSVPGKAHMTRPFFQPKSSPISRPMKPRRSQSHIPNCASCCSKSSTADTQWKISDMCVRGCSLASMWFNYKDERRLALGTIWCKVNLYFVRSRFILYRILCIWHLHVHGDQITMHISMYILCCSGKIVYILLLCQSLCIFGRVRWMCLSGVSCSLFDLMVWELPVTMVSFKSLSLKTFYFKWSTVLHQCRSFAEK